LDFTTRGIYSQRFVKHLCIILFLGVDLMGEWCGQIL